MNTMKINGFQAKIEYDSEIDLFRGEFLGLNGGADFYANDIEGLHKEGKISLQVFLDMCKEKGIVPRKDFSGKFTLRVSPEIHEKLALRAAASGSSLNKWIVETLDQVIDFEDQ